MPAVINFFSEISYFFATVRSMGQKSWDNKAIKGKGGQENAWLFHSWRVLWDGGWQVFAVLR